MEHPYAARMAPDQILSCRITERRGLTRGPRGLPVTPHSNRPRPVRVIQKHIGLIPPRREGEPDGLLILGLRALSPQPGSPRPPLPLFSTTEIPRPRLRPETPRPPRPPRRPPSCTAGMGCAHEEATACMRSCCSRCCMIIARRATFGISTLLASTTPGNTQSKILC